MNEITDLTGGGWVIPAYDHAGNATQFPQPTAPSTAAQATYDAWNRMVQVLSSGAPIQQNAYDGKSRRVSTLAAGTSRDYYLSLNWQTLEGRVSAETTSDRQFVWGLRNINDLLVRDRNTERLYALQDPNSNVTATTDTSANVVERYLYAAYGQPTFLRGDFAVIATSAYDWATLFGAYAWDSGVGVYYVRYRFLIPVLGTWLTADLVPIDVGDPNLYRYAGNGPIGAADPLGLDCEAHASTPFKIGDRVAKTDYAAIYGDGCSGGQSTYLIIVDFSSWTGKECDLVSEEQMLAHEVGVPKVGKLDYLFNLPSGCTHAKTSFFKHDVTTDKTKKENCNEVEFVFFCDVVCKSCQCVPDPPAGTLRIGTTPYNKGNTDTIVSWKINFPKPKPCQSCPPCDKATIDASTGPTTFKRP
ncbi:MAG TPA: RHS repeat-associated core domain-containing protein [Pirellulales bacterium]|nr:RHS repeat-associated core domain-containing protein [Pirellulales bacterium]